MDDEAMKRRSQRDHEAVPLPDLCSAQGLFALVLVAALAVTVMQLAPEHVPSWRGFSVGLPFAVWLSVVLAVTICKARPWLERLPRVFPYLAAWSWIVLLSVVLSVLIGWIDHSLRLGLTRDSTARFTLTNGVVVALIGAALLRYFYVLAQWRARLAAVSRAQVQALQARIRPHFLFNSMNTVAALVRVDPGAAERTVEDLADLFRAALASESEGTLGEELRLVDRYLDIEQLRLGERLRIERDLDALPRDFTLPRLLLQPLVENAIRHGIAPRRDGGTVRLGGSCDEDQVCIVVDNPLPDEAVPKLDEDDGHGHGLHSVRQRIAYHYGERGRLDVLESGGRYVVTVCLPRGGA
jgi:two-component system, LytTR family, sensor histidine kinase AlgZ